MLGVDCLNDTQCPSCAELSQSSFHETISSHQPVPGRTRATKSRWWSLLNGLLSARHHLSVLSYRIGVWFLCTWRFIKKNSIKQMCTSMSRKHINSSIWLCGFACGTMWFTTNVYQMCQIVTTLIVFDASSWTAIWKLWKVNVLLMGRGIDFRRMWFVLLAT
jgi:hypothetical protein